MSFSILPRKRTDAGGYLCMPLVCNLPNGDKGWEKINCPVCGEPCWKQPGDEETIQIYQMDGAMCTVCSLKHSLGEKRTL